jgi:hypothetical protein
MIVDLYLVYQFIKRLVTPFNQWAAFKSGIIDDKGNIIKKPRDRSSREKQTFGKFDLMLLKLKKLLAKIPGGQTKLATYAAALWLIKEGNENADEALMEEQLLSYMDYITENADVNTKFDLLFEDGIVNSAGSGNVQGIGVGPKGEPGLNPKQMNKYKKGNQAGAPYRIPLKTMVP